MNSFYSEEFLISELRRLRSEGWDTKIVRRQPAMPGDNNEKIIKLQANFGHINLRGIDSVYHLYGRYPNRVEVNGWIFSVYTRNANGGYEVTYQDADFGKALEKAKSVATGVAPAIPTWDRDTLPEPFALPTQGTMIQYQNRTLRANDRREVFCTTIETLVYTTTIVGIVAIGKDCSVSLDAATVPGNRTWVLMKCGGTAGNFYLITDGTDYYHTRKMGEKFKVSIAQKSGSIDLGRLTTRDSFNIRIMVREYLAWFQHEVTK